MPMNWERAGGAEWIEPETWLGYRSSTILGVLAKVVREEGDRWFAIAGDGAVSNTFSTLEEAMDAAQRYIDLKNPGPFP